MSYSRKHNEENGEDNRDGFDHNLACNYGVEGPSDDPAGRGRPQPPGEELPGHAAAVPGHARCSSAATRCAARQRGNNNAWCQNNEVSWYDWRLLERHADIHRFTRALIALRLAHPVFQRAEFYSGEGADRDRLPDIRWLGPDGGELDWKTAGQALGCRLEGSRAQSSADRDDLDFLLLFNAGPRPLDFRLPSGGWRRAVDTGLPPPQDAVEPGREPPVQTQAYSLAGRALAVLISA